MNLRSSFLALCAALLVGITIPAAAVAPGPYLVYTGTITETSDLSATEGAAILAEINSTPANTTRFHRINPNIQRDVTATAASHTATTKSPVYLIVDAQDMSQFTVAAFDSTGVSGERIGSFPSGNPSANAGPENLLVGFQFPTRGGLGILRFSMQQVTQHSVKDPVSGQPGTFFSQAYGTGALVDTTNVQIVASHTGESFYSVVNGVKTGAEHIIPMTPAILLPTGGAYMPKITGTVLGYYFDGNPGGEIGGASTNGTFSLELDPTLTHLANYQGEYYYDFKNSGLVNPITASTPAAFAAWVHSIINICIPPPAP